MKSSKQLKVAIVCDWLTGIGGAERVVLELHRMFPDAPIYTSQYDASKIDWFLDADVRTGWLQKLPGALKKFLPVFRSLYFSRLDLSQYDLVISESGAEAKGIKFGATTKHIAIINAPTHYYWSRYEAYQKNPGFPAGFNWLARIALKILVGPLRRWDKKAAQLPTHIVAISSHIQTEIKKYYGRDSVIIHPPVDTKAFDKRQTASGKLPKRHGFLVTGRQVPYKRIDLAVQACSKLNLPLTVIGDGPQHEYLKRIAGPTITIAGLLPRQEVIAHMQSAKALLFPGLDDFGIVPVEAMAAGTPVIAYKGGGALDYVIPGKTGEFFSEQTVDSLANALTAFNPQKYSSRDIKNHAEIFSGENFQKNLSSFINNVLQ